MSDSTQYTKEIHSASDGPSGWFIFGICIYVCISGPSNIPNYFTQYHHLFTSAPFLKTQTKTLSVNKALGLPALYPAQTDLCPNSFPQYMSLFINVIYTLLNIYFVSQMNIQNSVCTGYLTMIMLYLPLSVKNLHFYFHTIQICLHT